MASWEPARGLSPLRHRLLAKPRITGLGSGAARLFPFLPPAPTPKASLPSARRSRSFGTRNRFAPRTREEDEGNPIATSEFSGQSDGARRSVFRCFQGAD